jgi:hypothetical protein
MYSRIRSATTPGTCEPPAFSRNTVSPARAGNAARICSSDGGDGAGIVWLMRPS